MHYLSIDPSNDGNNVTSNDLLAGQVAGLFSVGCIGSGTVDRATGFASEVSQIDNGGTTTNAVNFVAVTSAMNSGTITHSIAFRALSDIDTGSITNFYGLKYYEVTGAPDNFSLVELKAGDSACAGNFYFLNCTETNATSVLTDTQIKTGCNLKFFESDNSNYMGFVAGTNSTDVIWQLPLSDAQGAFISSGSGVMSIKTLDNGTYTPTLTNATNISASTAYSCQWMRVGNTVTVSGKVDIDATSSGATELGVSLPVASNFGADEDCAGVAVPTISGEDAIFIKADATNNRASFQSTKTDTSNHTHYFTFTYEVI
jgi:hypothetical protein